MNKLVVLLLVGALCASQLNQMPVAETEEEYFMLGDVEVVALDEPIVSTEVDSNGIDWDKVWNIAKKVWEIVEKGKPVVNWNQNYATIVPKGLSSWEAMESWHAPSSRTYSINYKNLLGMTVVSFKYRIVYTWGGSYNGKGRYLSHVTIDPADLDVAWGYTFESGVSVADPVNVGSSNSPVAGVQVDLRWKVKTVLKENNMVYSYFVQGDGSFHEI